MVLLNWDLPGRLGMQIDRNTTLEDVKLQIKQETKLPIKGLIMSSCDETELDNPNSKRLFDLGIYPGDKIPFASTMLRGGVGKSGVYDGKKLLLWYNALLELTKS